MAKRIGPEAKIIALFTALPDDSKRIVMDVIKSQVARPKSIAPAAGRKSSRKPGATGSTASTGTPKDAVGTVVLPDNPDDFHKPCAVPNCGEPESGEIHLNDDHPFFHVYHAEIKTKKASA